MTYSCPEYVKVTSVMKVDKDHFDALLQKMMQAPPEPKKAIKTERKMARIIPPIPPPSTPHKV